MKIKKQTFRVIDKKGRITLPSDFANQPVIIEINGENEIVIRKAKIVPLEESSGRRKEENRSKNNEGTC